MRCFGCSHNNIDEGYNFLEALIFSASSAAGFALALVIFAGMREQLALSDVPKPFQGMPIALISAGLLSLAFFGFVSGEDVENGQSLQTD